MGMKYDEYGNPIGWEEEGYPPSAGANGGNAGPQLRSYSMEYADTPNGKPNTNVGSPGSKTEEINSQWKNWGDRWVDTGDTGGSLRGVTTIKEGSSMTEADRQRYLNAADTMGIPKEWRDSFLGRNADDESRLWSAYQSELKGGDGGSGGGGIGAGGGGQGGGGGDDWLRSMLRGIGTNGAMNQDILNRRVSNASDRLNANRKSQLGTNEAYLASRGLIGDGPQKTANDLLEGRLGDQFNSAVNDIYANEAENADQRMMMALGLAQGLDIADANRLVDWFRAQTEREGVGNNMTLGLGNLALGNLNAMNNYNLGMAGLDYNSQLSLLELLNRAGITVSNGQR